MWYMIRNDELYHHGILGQKWGKRNGPPYPLDAKSHSKSEQKAGWRNSLDKDSSDAYNKRQKEHKGLTDKQKKAIKIGAAATATALVAIGGYALYKSGKLDSVIGRGKEKAYAIFGPPDGFLNANSDSLESVATKLHLPFDQNFVLREDNILNRLQGINPTDSRTNCGSTAVCSVLNCLGFRTTSFSDVPKEMCARGENGIFSNSYDPKKLLWAFPQAKTEDLMGNFLGKKDAAKKLTEQLASYGEGATGILWGQYDRKIDPDGSGHYIAWRVLNGKVFFMDGQANPLKLQHKALFNDFFSGIGKSMQPDSLTWARLDQSEIDQDFLKYIVRSA